MMQYHYVCSDCGTEYELKPNLMLCPDCARSQDRDQPLSGILEVALEGEVGQGFAIHDLLPVEKEYFPSIPVGASPLWGPEKLRTEFEFPNLYVKDDTGNLTGSFKDRASILVSAFARKYGFMDIALASTGNAASSMAGVGAAAGQRVTVFLPKSVPRAKIVQALQYGSRVHKVEGSYDLAYEFSLEYSRRNGGLNRNTAYNPLTIEGKKTVSLELFRQLPKTPDSIFVPAGDGCILSGVYKGFKDLLALGLIQTMPTVYAVQAEKSSAIARAFQSGSFERIPAETLADSIAVDVPKSGLHALKQLKKYQGRVLTVSDREIIEAQARLSAGSGLFAEPAAAAAFAGFLKARAGLDREAQIVLLITGSGLKDIDSALEGVSVPEKTISSVEEITG
ncbi:MAG: pyridoxal-phosphate dependent enzyme [Desulfohalobiaceae bacterium]|nr:pyridoxal-phosphate dependent enzyme [Desulfohalobiaceae bacterium]